MTWLQRWRVERSIDGRVKEDVFRYQASKDDYGSATADDNPFAGDHFPRNISASLRLEESASCLMLQQPR